jgi:hypothetical protein
MKPTDKGQDKPSLVDTLDLGPEFERQMAQLEAEAERELEHARLRRRKPRARKRHR